MRLLENRVALITGAASGIGAAAARRFAAEGASLVLLDVAERPLGELAAEIGSDRALAKVVDVADEDATRAAIDTAVQRYGGVDVGLLNVGVTGMLAPI